MIHQPTMAGVGEAQPQRPVQRREDGRSRDRDPERGPTCRLVDAIPAATPAWDRGMPDTAVLVIGAFTTPEPMPNTR